MYGYMGTKKTVKKHGYIKGVCRKVRNVIRTCKIYHLVKCNNERKEAIMIPIRSNNKLDKVFMDICGLFPRSEGCHANKFILIMFDHYTELYPIRKAITKAII